MKVFYAGSSNTGEGLLTKTGMSVLVLDLEPVAGTAHNSNNSRSYLRVTTSRARDLDTYSSSRLPTSPQPFLVNA